jgi:uncharacterized protein involved in exopolysaccharide biosynthesis
MNVWFWIAVGVVALAFAGCFAAMVWQLVNAPEGEE